MEPPAELGPSPVELDWTEHNLEAVSLITHTGTVTVLRLYFKRIYEYFE